MKNTCCKIILGQIIFCLSLAVLPDYSLAQHGYWGIKTGVNLGKITGIEFTNQIKPGFHGGVFANFEISEKFSMQHEVLISFKGISTNLPGIGNYKQNFNYIDIPWFLNYHFSDVLFVNAGIQPSLYAFFKRPQADTIPYNKYNVTPIDFSFIIGAGVILENNLGFGMRINKSLVETFMLDEQAGEHLLLQAYISYAVNRNSKGGRWR